jgi:putative membrane protein
MNEQLEIIIKKASFNPKVKTYIFFIVLFYLIISIAGWLLIPFWILGLGQWLSNKYFNTLQCELSDRNLKFSKGFIVHVEKTIPLENIQDLSFIGGPILRKFGLVMIKVETAGGGGGHHNQNMMSMIGINDAEDFKKNILNQREKVKNKFTASNAQPTSNKDIQLLQDIKDELVEIKNVLKKG